MAVISTETLPVVSEADIVTVRRCVRESAQKLGFSLVDQTKVVTAASELARNTLIHAVVGLANFIENLGAPIDFSVEFHTRESNSLHAIRKGSPHEHRKWHCRCWKPI